MGSARRASRKVRGSRGGPSGGVYRTAAGAAPPPAPQEHRDDTHCWIGLSWLLFRARRTGAPSCSERVAAVHVTEARLFLKCSASVFTAEGTCFFFVFGHARVN